MALNSTGPLSLGGSTAGESVNLALGKGPTDQISFNDADVRTLTATVAGSALILPTNFYGKSLGFSMQYVIVGGGGGGGYDVGGGGGGGGFLTGTTAGLTGGNSQVWTITVGSGGTGDTTGSSGTSGGNSSIATSGFTTITAVGGGRGASSTTAAGNGGSGGGGGAGSATETAGTGTAGQGSAGGTGFVPPVPTTPGQPFGGGYYAGKINQGGTQYYLIVAPLASGQAGSALQWKTSNTTTPGTTSVIDGPANSAAMNNANHPAAQYCEGLTIGGFSDWYLPAKNELEVCYYFLKPDMTSNYTASGANPDAVAPEPISTNYTGGSPARTSVTAFQTGGTEAFIALNYWSSTEDAATYAWIQEFNDGIQNSGTKLNSYFVRAVRRVPV